MVMQNGCSDCGGIGFTMPDIPGQVKGWFDERGMDWRLGLGILAVGAVAFMYVGVAGSKEEGD